jgi:hypothetical protein
MRAALVERSDNVEQIQEDDDGNRNAEYPKQNSTHELIPPLMVVLINEGRRR